MPDEDRIEVDADICIGAGQCEVLAPGTFELDEDGIVTLVDAGGDPDEAQREAVAGCPSGALRLVAE